MLADTQWACALLSDLKYLFYSEIYTSDLYHVYAGARQGEVHVWLIPLVGSQ